MQDLYSTNAYAIRQFSKSEADAKGGYRFLSNDRVSEKDIVKNLSVARPRFAVNQSRE